MKITAQDLLDLMPIVRDRGWRVLPPLFTGSDRLVIRDRDGRCPICALAYDTDSSIDAYTGAMEAVRLLLEVRRLSALEQLEIEAITHAADCKGDPLRPALMQALGMT